MSRRTSVIPLIVVTAIVWVALSVFWLAVSLIERTRDVVDNRLSHPGEKL